MVTSNSNACAGLVRPVFFWMLASIRWVLASGMSLAVVYSNAHAQSMQLPVMDLTIGSQKIAVEVASTDQSRSYGLMHRMSLPPDTGMLFVFDRVGQPCFWMKNTPLPLSIAFIDHHGTIVNMADMQPHSRVSHCPQAPVLYALEMEQGWFETKGILPGTRVSPLPQP